MLTSWPYPFKLGVVLNEIDPDPFRALPLARQMGMTHVEFGSLWGRPVHQLDADDLSRVRDEIARHGLQVAMVGPEAFKTVLLGHLGPGEIATDAHFQAEYAAMRRVMELAHYFDAGLVRTFSFRREGMVGLGNPSPREPKGGDITNEMLERITIGLSLICALAEEMDVQLGLENVRSCWANSGHNTARIVEAVGSPRLHVVWDPANAYVSGEAAAYPDGYAALREHTVHVHLKDARVLDEATGLTEWACIGDGAVDYSGQMAALCADGYTGVVSIETHWAPPDKTPAEATRLTTAGLRRVLATL